ncbi:mannose-P-dolichol utilization defect 1 protein [Phlegmacium glaucopus]|nr:mannose-P-dolichol utilization defect 1 protein [Phlegmacium glaucopus]
MTAITQNLPSFIKDLGISIIGKECYTSLVENLNITDVKCLKYSLSKGLGIGIVVGGSIMKVPQILLIVNGRSARGLSLPAYILETLSYAITLAYSFRHQFPFSTYGENFFLTLQNTLITLLIIFYAPSRALTGKSDNKLQSLVLTCLITLMTTLPLSLFSKLPQIRQNSRSQSTGQLSAFAVISQIAGCLARLFTTATEVGDSLVSAGFALALILNIILGAQLWMYWGQGDVKDEFGLGREAYSEEKVKSLKQSSEAATWQVHQPRAAPPTTSASPVMNNARQVSTPPPNRPSSAGRKWARKLD